MCHHVLILIFALCTLLTGVGVNATLYVTSVTLCVTHVCCVHTSRAAMRGYCQREVEPMGKESEQLHVTALSEALGLRVSIQYLDGRCESGPARGCMPCFMCGCWCLFVMSM